MIEEIKRNSEEIKERYSVYEQEKRRYENEKAVYESKLTQMVKDIKEIYDNGGDIDIGIDIDISRLEDDSYREELKESLGREILKLQEEYLKELEEFKGKVY